MIFTELNREHRIGATCQVVEIGDFRIVIDAGMDPKVTGPAATPDLSAINGESIDLIVLTHCHLDHLGCLPILLRQHPEATVVCSTASFMLAPRMLANSINVMKRQREELGIAEYPLYTKGDLRALETRLTPIGPGQAKTIQKGRDSISLTLHPAGHIPGAVGVELTHKHRRIFFTGDVQFENQRILDGAQFPDGKLDTLVMETTRGATERPPGQNRETELKRMYQSIQACLAQRGRVLIPAFALGRMQELLALLHDARSQGDIPQCPVFCSGLGMALVDYFDAITRKTKSLRFRRHLLESLDIHPYTMDHAPGKAPGPSGIFLLSSGMMVEHTPSYVAASGLLGDPNNIVCFTGYCDPDTPGGRLLVTPHKKSFLFETLDFETPVRARIERFDLSGHADREELIDYALARDPRAVVLCHGDPAAREWFVNAFAERAPEIKVTDPMPGQSYKV